jgi:outer membrane protein OmpA-like peptidoglycan-associated protein
MSMRILLLTGAAFSAACANRSPELQQPVGQTMLGAPPAPPQDVATAVAPPDSAPNDVEPYVTGKSAGPCGTEPPIIEFNASSTEIAEAQAQELRSLAACLTSAPYETASVVLVGYTDVMGTVPANLELGLARAQVVMRQLMSSGVAPGRIVVASAGELQRPHARWGLHAHRVEILIARGGPTRPDEAPIVRGIEAEGLLRRPQTDTPARPVVRGTPSANVVPPSPRGR